MLFFLKVVMLFSLSAIAEIVGCYLPWLVIKQHKPWWLLIPAAVSLSVFAWLLTLHPFSAGRTYAAYGSVYIVVALVWLVVVEAGSLTRWDIVGALITLLGMSVIVLQPSSS